MIQLSERLLLDTEDDLYLSRITADDATDLRTYLNSNPSVTSDTPEVTEVSAYRAGMIVNYDLMYMDAGLKAPYLLRQQDGTIIGRVELQGRIGGEYAVTRYSIAEAVRGRGLAGLALGKLVQQGQERHDLRRVGFWIQDTNLASQSVARKMGASYMSSHNNHDNGQQVLQYWEKTL